MPFKKPLEWVKNNLNWTRKTPRASFFAQNNSPRWENKIKMQNRAGHGVRVKHSDIGIKG